MRAFTVRWRSARQHREFEIAAGPEIAAPLCAALQAGGGFTVWDSGTIWRCGGCGDRTVKTEEFLEGLRRAEIHLEREAALRQREESAATGDDRTLTWLQTVSARLLACERDRVYVKDDGGSCTFEQNTYISRI